MSQERAGTVQLGEGKAQGDLTCVYKHLRGGWREEGSRLLSVVPGDKRQWAQMETLEGPSKCPGVMESPSLEVFKATWTKS